ncbi:MAG: PD-(D/E)XK nuclease family protein [Actinomycetota bacterium]
MDECTLENPGSNTLVEAIASLCAEEPLKPKIIIAPSNRAGNQWLERVAMSGRPVLNAGSRTLRGLALELSAPLMVEQGLQLAGGIRAQVLMDRAFARISPKEPYLSRLEPGPGLVRTLLGAVRDLRLAGLDADAIDERAFEVRSKGAEVKALLEAFESVLAEGGFTDYAGCLRLAVERVTSDRGLPLDSLVAIPADLEERLAGLERELWSSIPRDNRRVLDVDLPGDASTVSSRRYMLSFALHADGAKGSDPFAPHSSEGDGVTMYRAVGEVNEVREVFRRVVEEGLPFDDVEVLYTEPATYLPLLFELASRLAADGSDELPVTFLEGVPTRYSRPGRALAGWLDWVRGGDFPQGALVHMVHDGLLEIPAVQGGDLSFARLGAILRSVAIGAGRERYLAAMDSEGRALTSQIAGLDEAAEEGHDAQRRRSLSERLEGLGALRELVAGLLEVVPSTGGQVEALRSASLFLARHARHSGKFDEYGRVILLDSVAEIERCLEDGEVAGFEPWSWLDEVISSTGVEGSGPAPGRLHAAPLTAGGHSGRGHTFIVGFDEARFPGSGRQDPVLLDGERERLSDDLLTGEARLTGELEQLMLLFARLRGEVTLSYCCRSLADDRELFPSPVLLSAYRVLEKRDGDQQDLDAYCGDPVSFAPASPERAIDTTEWWLSLACGRTDRLVPAGLVAASFPHLGRGMRAREMRESQAFTEYDGYVPEAASECDPAREGARPLSASALEELARCPLEYFLHRVLRIDPLEEYEIDPNEWLDARQVGHFLHGCFRIFLERLDERGERPSRDAHLAELRRLFDDELAYWRRGVPPHNEASYRAQARMLERAACIFLTEEELHCVDRRPAYFEVSIGRMPDLPGRRGNEIDKAEPVLIALPTGAVFLAHGQMDRVDELPRGDEGRRFEVCDYKSGGTGRYDVNDPFACGRHVQNILYTRLLQSRLDELFPGARVEGFNYYFPSLYGRGERVGWTMDELEAGETVLADLCAMLATGCFPFTINPGLDLAYSDFVFAYGDVAYAAGQARVKVDNAANAVLLPYRELRAGELDEQEEEGE